MGPVTNRPSLREKRPRSMPLWTGAGGDLGAGGSGGFPGANGNAKRVNPTRLSTWRKFVQSPARGRMGAAALIIAYTAPLFHRTRPTLRARSPVGRLLRHNLSGFRRTCGRGWDNSQAAKCCTLTWYMRFAVVAELSAPTSRSQARPVQAA